MRLFPIILFVYNRPDHTRRTLESLSKNEGAKNSTLYIFSDSYKENALLEGREKIIHVRRIIREKQWCGRVIISESNINKGLANSVIEGVSDILRLHKAAIILEDDIVTNSGFLKFMNTALRVYEKDKKVYGVSGYKFDHYGEIQDETFFLPVMSSWGYGTWSDRWDKINFNSNHLLEKIESLDLGSKMRFGSIDYYMMLKAHVAGNINSWAVRFQTSMFLDKGVFLYPNTSLIHNIGFDGSGEHCEHDDSKMNYDQVISKAINIIPTRKKVFVKTKTLKKFNEKQAKKNFNLHFLKFKLYQKAHHFLPPEILQYIKRKRKKIDKEPYQWLRNIPRYKNTQIILFNKQVTIPDSASFLFMYDEIFKKEIYKFKSDVDTPYIIDGGANVGLATIYFKNLHPKSRVVAFEPDSKIFEILKSNIDAFNYDDVHLYNIGLLDYDGDISFSQEGADAGTVVLNENQVGSISTIKVGTLGPFLKKTVDFLKLDIEGAETKVLVDIKDSLENVKRIFIEYHSFVDKDQTLYSILEILYSNGFRVFINSPGLHNHQPFIKVETYNNMDMQLNIYGIKHL
ncbi:methyltransferase, FkbM family [Nonlabens sp. Hel1_33_55]|uniref:FkbM family methyltransferase n=1 Tax=Nonlabens sp. Hel1_33_55 TaxID=1336802 RepID=UPI000875E896|nr:FkbM family methyltransferase [Nonlabens sp. Hel1_33_55]SCX92144.1 methyltransferase, FkbM family [Nonlabens sp. Hel1_33_55]